MKKTVTSIFITALALALCLCLLVACDTSDGRDTDAYAIPDGLNVEIGIHIGTADEAGKSGTVTKAVLSGLNQSKVTLTTVNSSGAEKTVVYIAYALSDALSALEIAPDAIEAVHAYSPDGYDKLFTLTSLADSYITIGIEENGALVDDEDGPRFISDKTSTSANDVVKKIVRLVINPVDPTTPTLGIKMTQGDKVNDLTVPNVSLSAPVSNVSYDYVKDGVTTTYYGFELRDILDSMGKNGKTGQWIGFFQDLAGTDYKVEFETAPDASGAVEKCAFTAAEIGNAGGESANFIKVVYDPERNCARVFSSYDDTDPRTYRNKFKGAVKMTVYNPDGSVNATLEMSWTR